MTSDFARNRSTDLLKIGHHHKKAGSGDATLDMYLLVVL
ncbi:hypothetical protein LEWO105114_05940 [Legionella worsleiensis]|nr:Uncharacterised protein [Legionella worsleiensis]